MDAYKMRVLKDALEQVNLQTHNVMSALIPVPSPYTHDAAVHLNEAHKHITQALAYLAEYTIDEGV